MRSKSTSEKWGLVIVIGLILLALGYGIGQQVAARDLVEPPTERDREVAAYTDCFAGRARASLLRLDELAFEGEMTDSDPAYALASAEAECEQIFDEGPECDDTCRSLRYTYDLGQFQ